MAVERALLAALILLCLTPCVAGESDAGRGDAGGEAGDETGRSDPGNETAEGRSPQTARCDWLIIVGPNTNFPFIHVTFRPDCFP